jgi:DNA polymerase III subunit alpha
VDCSLSSLADKQDGSWVTVGGIVTEFKRHKSKNGSLMSFATLDDVEGQVEMLVMGKAYEVSQEFLAADAIVVVRGKLDHKGRGDTKLVAQEVEHFQPSEDELAKARAARERDSGPLRLRIDASAFGVTVIEELKTILGHFPGSSEVLLVMQTRQGTRELQFGREYRVRRSAALDAELAALLGTASQAA